jgi:isoquinoline 1-oxidoreductase beta subunit
MTALSMLVADELGADWRRVSAEFAPADRNYINPASGAQVTGGSNSVRGFFTPMREASAAAREMLIIAGARRLGVAAPTCRADQHAIIHGPSGNRVGFSELIADAALLPVPSIVFVKTPDQFRFIGKPMPRLDTPEKVRGTAIFGQDVQLPGLLVAMVERPSAFGAQLKSFDAVAAYRIPGVRHVFPVPTGVAVVADSFPAAQRARAALQTRWTLPSTLMDDASIDKRLGAALRKTKTVRQEGDVAGQWQQNKRIEAEYHVPYQAHACMEPMNCTAHVRDDGCDLWVGTQAPGRAQQMAMDITGLAQERVRVHNVYLGGGFGRRAEQDFVAEAVQISQTAGVPVKLLWTREDDLKHDYYRPISRHWLRAQLDERGRPIAWEHRIVSPSILARIAPGSGKKAPDGTSLEGAVNLPYTLPHVRVAYAPVDVGVPVGFWRSVGSSQNAFVTECFLDEVAAAAGQDPFELRRALLREKPRHRRVLELAAEKAGWGKPMLKGRARGIAVAESFRSFVAEVAEASIVDGQVRVHRMVCAVDCGFVVNPDTVKAQMEGAIVYGLTAALKGAIRVQEGGVMQGNFDDYPLLRMDETPAIEVHIVTSDEPPGGVGEPGVPPAAPAVANAVFALTGRPVRRLPIEIDTEGRETGSEA